MGQTVAEHDPIAGAISAVDQANQPQQVTIMQLQVPLGSGRPMIVGLPADFTDVEALQAVQALLMAMDRIRAERAAQTTSGILLPGRPKLVG